MVPSLRFPPLEQLCLDFSGWPLGDNNASRIWVCRFLSSMIISQSLVPSRFRSSNSCKDCAQLVACLVSSSLEYTTSRTCMASGTDSSSRAVHSLPQTNRGLWSPWTASHGGRRKVCVGLSNRTVIKAKCGVSGEFGQALPKPTHKNPLIRHLQNDSNNPSLRCFKFKSCVYITI